MSNQENLTAKIFDNFVRPEILERVVSDDVKAATIPISCVRLFDPSMLKAVLQKTIPEQFGSWQIGDFGDLLLKFKQSSLLVWDKGYAIDSRIRQMINGYLRENEPKMYRGAHTAAIEVYRDWLKRPVDNRSLFVVEELYHLANLNPEADLTGMLKKRLDEYPHWFRDGLQHQSQVENLSHLLQSDDELKELTGFVPGMITMVGEFADNIR